MLGYGLDGLIVGIVGLGWIGMVVVRWLVFFGVKRFFYSGYSFKNEVYEIGVEFMDFNVLLSKFDFVLGCCVLMKENLGLFDKDVFMKMKFNVIFVNISWGGFVN